MSPRACEVTNTMELCHDLPLLRYMNPFLAKLLSDTFANVRVEASPDSAQEHTNNFLVELLGPVPLVQGGPGAPVVAIAGLKAGVVAD